MSRRVDRKPPSAAKGLKMGDRPPCISNKQHTVIQVVTVLAAAALIRYFKYRTSDTFPNALSDAPLARFSNEFDRDLWGSYRPQAYFSLRTRSPVSPLFGIGWYSHAGQKLLSEFRHDCSQNDGIKYMWKAADGKSFGHQDIHDGPVNITTKWFNRGKSFVSEIDVKRKDKGVTGLILYFAAQNPHTSFMQDQESEGPKLWIHTPKQPDFSLEFDISAEKYKTSTLKMTTKLWITSNNIMETVKTSLGMDEDNNIVFQTPDKESFNLFALHIDITGNAKIQVEYRDHSEKDLPDFETEFKKREEIFDQTVRNAFASSSKVTKSMFEMGKSALSNMLGGVGYWYGLARMRSITWPAHRVEPYGPLELFSAVPSRPFFPRGFIWDEGFHNVLIHKVDQRLSLDILTSWLNCMNADGWIPREMILGPEAETKVPADFLVQSDNVANPPVFFYLMEKFMQNSRFMAQYKNQIISMYPRLKKWYFWLRDTQQGPYKGVFQWQGRNETTNLELNPKTLASGLDDYPRASHPTMHEYHLDIKCWLAVASRVIRYLAELSSDALFINEADDDQRVFGEMETLNKFHWSSEKKRYADFGFHSYNVELYTEVTKDKEGRTHRRTLRRALEEPENRLVDDVYGYVSLFPFLLKLLPAESEQLKIILDQLGDPELLWTPYGLRSVAKNCVYYNKMNTQHDPPYWRGNIWINMNYMALEALNHYSTKGGSTAEKSRALYDELKHNVLNNVFNVYRTTGLFWEHYNDTTGVGQGTRPFTGWTALVFAIMADNYD
ncbi:unnamed protein product [Bursaphelenchus okinawaensis]|uniref:Mannosyl-oligosaccharide glucosidase n=1 Tax=Bursaphelenchus okinawaensis TaxID=465554 RepID=A0A811KS67_9BILA|nr:unnamed protein product [Bursaphelenchus okinawaensis]CAG9112484.1 unnamed protein product [Bursaphelenchus okinawaensis]